MKQSTVDKARLLLQGKDNKRILLCVLAISVVLPQPRGDEVHRRRQRPKRAMAHRLG